MRFETQLSVHIQALERASSTCQSGEKTRFFPSNLNLFELSWEYSNPKLLLHKAFKLSGKFAKKFIEKC
jgi:hypothetical protein